MKITMIQYLRGLAALLVVLAHNSSLMGGGLGKYIPGALGVDIFFIISGFIMTFITHSKPDRPVIFIVKRIFRIWPIFFLVWLLSFIIVYPERSMDDMGCVLRFCLQDYSRPGPTFGYSALGPPWTLTYEMMFYCVFAISMGLSYRYRSLVCALIFVAAALGFQLYYNGQFSFSSRVSPDILVEHWWQALIKLASNTITFEFITGMLLAELMISGGVSRSQYIQSLMKGVLFISAIAAFIIGPQVFGIDGGYWLAAIIMTAVVVICQGHPSGHHRVLNFLGDISYSLYLVHYPVMSFLKSHLAVYATAGEKVGLFFMSITISITLATLMFMGVEKPSIRAGKRVAETLSLKLRAWQESRLSR